jgi:2-desacetyl-2-hydroxyethyl bacteriochlorophyllide A dehydrogenase
MKALVITGPGATEYRELAEPVPGPGEVLLEVRYVGLCGSDLASFRGSNPLVSYPRVPGHEVSGVVSLPGPDVAVAAGTPALVVPYSSCGRCSACSIGRANACRENRTLGVQRDGALTERLVVPASKLLMSRTLDLRAMTLVEPVAVGWHAAARARAVAGTTVAVFGCGVVGLGAVAGASARGARVIAIDVAERKLELARAAGADQTIDSTHGGLHQALSDLTNGNGPEVCIEAIGLPETFRACVDEVAFAGRVVYVGYTKRPVEYETKLFVQKELDIMGSRNALPADFAGVLSHYESGAFPVEALVTRTVPFAEAGAALAAWDGDPSVVTKILVRMM